jgi:NADPH:quinone reductase-like Zn-dependent oxidoreductase
VLLALLSGGVLPATKIDISAFLRKRARFEGSTLRSRDLEYQIKLRDLFVELVLPGLLSGVYKHHVDRVFKWEDIREAHELLERNGTMGKVVCVVE